MSNRGCWKEEVGEVRQPENTEIREGGEWNHRMIRSCQEEKLSVGILACKGEWEESVEMKATQRGKDREPGDSHLVQ